MQKFQKMIKYLGTAISVGILTPYYGVSIRCIE